MDLTTQRLANVAFEERRRGYDPEQVDQFLAEVETGVAELQDQVSRLQQRVREAEAEADTDGTKTEIEETLTRTLVLAQRTADTAVEEAHREAEQIVVDAQEEAAKMVAVSEAKAQTIRDAAESEARRLAESTRAPMLEEIRELEQIRNFLMDDVELLEFHLEQHRGRLRDTVDSLREVLDDPESLRLTPAPELSGVSLERGLGSDDESGDDGDIDDDDSVEFTSDSDFDDDEWTAAEDADVDDLDDADDAELESYELPTEAVPEVSGDAFLDELRRAVSDGDEYEDAEIVFEDDEEPSRQA